MREFLKGLGRGVALVAVLPMLLSYAIRSRAIGRDRALEGSTQVLAQIPGIPGQYVRRAFLARTLVRCSSSATISYGTLFSKAGASIGDRAYVGPSCHLGLVSIEADVLVGAGVHVTSGRKTHGTDAVDKPIRDQEGQPELVRIGRGAWIGSASVVMADVGVNSVVGAGSVVTKAVPDAVVAAGVPAQVIRTRA